MCMCLKFSTHSAENLWKPSSPFIRFAPEFIALHSESLPWLLHGRTIGPETYLEIYKSSVAQNISPALILNNHKNHLCNPAQYPSWGSCNSLDSWGMQSTMIAGRSCNEFIGLRQTIEIMSYICDASFAVVAHFVSHTVSASVTLWKIAQSATFTKMR